MGGGLELDDIKVPSNPDCSMVLGSILWCLKLHVVFCKESIKNKHNLLQNHIQEKDYHFIQLISKIVSKDFARYSSDE